MGGPGDGLGSHMFRASMGSGAGQPGATWRNWALELSFKKDGVRVPGTVHHEQTMSCTKLDLRLSSCVADVWANLKVHITCAFVLIKINIGSESSLLRTVEKLLFYRAPWSFLGKLVLAEDGLCVESKRGCHLSLSSSPPPPPPQAWQGYSSIKMLGNENTHLPNCSPLLVNKNVITPPPAAVTGTAVCV